MSERVLEGAKQAIKQAIEQLLHDGAYQYVPMTRKPVTTNSQMDVVDCTVSLESASMQRASVTFNDEPEPRLQGSNAESLG